MDKFLCQPHRSKDHAANISAADRAKQYKSSDVYEDGGRLFCRMCNVVLNHIRKSVIDDHFKSQAHLRNCDKPPPKKQKTIDTTLNVNTIAAENRVAVCREWLTMMVSANIPVYKTDHHAVRDFLRTRVDNGGAIPGSDQLTNMYLPDLFDCEKRKLKSVFANTPAVAIITDETSDDKGRFVLNVLIAKMEEAPGNNVFLADTIFLENTNNTTVSQSVVKVVNDYGLAFNSIRIFCSDNAAYMQKAFRDTLSVLFPNCVHITCFAHIMNLICDAFREPFKDVATFGLNFKKLFAQPGARRARYLAYLKNATSLGSNPNNTNASITLAPNPVATRWNSWYEAMSYHNEHMHLYCDFITSEKLVAGNNASAALDWLVAFFGDPLKVDAVKVKLAFLSKKSVPLLQLLSCFESRIPYVVDAFEKLEDLRILLETNSQLAAESCEEFFNVAPSITVETKAAIMHQFEEAFSLAAQKLDKYITEGQPGIHFVKACRIFKPQNTVLLSRRKQDYSAIPGIEQISDDEFAKYINVIGPEAVQNSSDINPLDVLTFWKSVGDRLPGLQILAKMYLFSVTTSADAERSFSKYNQILSPQRLSLSEETIRMLEFLYWNLNVLTC